MPIDKLEKLRITDTDPSSTMSKHMQRIICCYRCGDSQSTLRRVKDEDGKRIVPVKFICMDCYKAAKGT